MPHPHAPSTPRRRSERRDPVAVTAAVLSRLFDTPVEVTSADLSPAGMFLASDLLLEPGDAVLVAFTPPGTVHQILVDARVVRADRLGRAGMGLEFARLPAIDEKILRASLETHRTQNAPSARSDGAFRC